MGPEGAADDPHNGNGNRLTKIRNGVTESYSYDDGDKLLLVAWTGGSKTYAYDAAGRTTSIVSAAGTTTLSYDFESRVTSLSGPGVSQTNTYNGLDTRVSKIENGASQTFVRDGAYVTDPVLRDSSATYTPGISERRGSVSTFQHSGIKNAASQSTAGGSLSAFRVYDAFGNLESGGFGAWQGPFGYAGSFGYQEDGSGLRLLGHRYYDSSTGRFLTRDPIKNGRNWYVYCGSNPMTMVDPAGLVRKELIQPIWNLINSKQLPKGALEIYETDKDIANEIHLEIGRNTQRVIGKRVIFDDVRDGILTEFLGRNDKPKGGGSSGKGNKDFGGIAPELLGTLALLIVPGGGTPCSN